MRNNLKRAIDTELRCLRTTQRERSNLLQSTLEGHKVKKKLSIGFVLVTVLVLAVTAALAATLLWEQYAAEVKQIEQEQGEYEQWPPEEKLSLVRNLLDMGYLEQSDDTARLFDTSTSADDQQTLADQLMLELTSQTDVREINLDIITYAILGPENTWTPEQRVWWQDITNMYRNSSNTDTLIVHGGNEISEEDATTIAKAAILKAYELPADALDNALPVANLYITDQRPDYKRWDVQFQLFKEGSDNYLVRVYSAIVDEEGNVIADPDLHAPSLEEKAAESRERQALEAMATPKPPIILTYLRYLEEQGYQPFGAWPVEVKAAYSREVRPLVAEALANGSLVPYDAEEGNSIENKNVIASTSYSYGMPESGDISQETAQEIALREIIEEFGLHEDDIWHIYPFYDNTDPDAPQWKFIFYTSYSEALQAMMLYKVELDPRTGDIAMSEAFEHVSHLEVELESALQWY